MNKVLKDKFVKKLLYIKKEIISEMHNCKSYKEKFAWLKKQDAIIRGK